MPQSTSLHQSVLDVYAVAAFYCFSRFDDYADRREAIFERARALELIGSVLLAAEGINATIAGSDRDNVDAFIAFLREDPRFRDLEVKYSTAEERPFYRLKVRLKSELVALGRPDVQPGDQVGEYVTPREWNTLISSPDVTVIDTRNDYEVRIGTFQGAVDPEIEDFRDFSRWAETQLTDKSKKIAMFCTGGIRCEKATSLLVREGYENVYHLEGGILRYLEEVPEAESLWRGECFVFDNRVSLKHGLGEGETELCFGCREPLAPADLDSPHFEAGVACPRCHERVHEDKRTRARERRRQLELAEARGEQHFGAPDEP